MNKCRNEALKIKVIVYKSQGKTCVFLPTPSSSTDSVNKWTEGWLDERRINRQMKDGGGRISGEQIDKQSIS